MTNPLHRDDVPYDVAEEIVAELKRRYPGMNIVFAGDHPTEESDQAFAAYEEHRLGLLARGACMDCGKQMPGWEEIVQSDNPQVPKGWRWFTNTANGDLMGFQCPECDANETDEPREIKL